MRLKSADDYYALCKEKSRLQIDERTCKWDASLDFEYWNRCICVKMQLHEEFVDSLLKK